MITIPAYPWDANRVLLLATFIVHSIMGPVRIVDNLKSPLLPLVYPESLAAEYEAAA